MSADGGLLDVFRSLDSMHGARGWHWSAETDPFEIAVGAILVQNTAWSNVERALGQLRAAGALTPEVMSRLPVHELETLVRPSGQYRQKALKLRAFLALVEQYGSLEGLLTLPAEELRPALLAMWGIGPETADCIVLYCAKQAAFVVDAYTVRLFTRVGIGPGATAGYDAWQAYFATRLPGEQELWARYHALIVLHCKHVCLKRAPRCGGCHLSAGCQFAREMTENR